MNKKVVENMQQLISNALIVKKNYTFDLKLDFLPTVIISQAVLIQLEISVFLTALHNTL
jgi:hypothetical protein